MSESTQTSPKLDVANLWREEVITDRKMGSIVVGYPINQDGSADETRAVSFRGQIEVMSAMGPMPIGFTIEATNLTEAINAFEAAAKQAIEDMVKRLQEMRREQSQRIVTPGSADFQLPPQL